MEESNDEKQVPVSDEQEELGLPEVPPELEEERPARQNFSPGLMGQIWEKRVPQGAKALSHTGELVARAKFEFILDGSVCTPGFFADEEGDYFDVRITLRSLDSKDELAALHGLRDAGQSPFRLAKACLYALNDQPLTSEQRDLLWEGLGMGGRQLVLVGFNSIGAASMTALGKFRRTFTPV